MVLKPGHEGEAKAIFDKWDLDFAVIGEIVEGGNLTLIFGGETVGDIPINSLVEDAPEYDRPHVATSVDSVPDFPAFDGSYSDALLALVGGPHLASREWIWRQYDHRVMNDTLVAPGSDAAVVRVHGTQKALAVSTDVTPRYCYADPVEGGKQAVAETWRNLTASGAKPLAITNCLNFGNPERPEIMGQFVGCIGGMRDACSALDYPVVSGNVSLYNETNGKGILPTPAIGGVGLITDLTKRAVAAFGTDGDHVILVGETTDSLSQSLYARELLGVKTGPAPKVDLKAERQNGDFVRSLIEAGTVAHCHDLSDGGLAAAVAEMAVASGLGARLTLAHEAQDAARLLFAESQGRYVLTVKPSDLGSVLDAAVTAGVSAQKLGTVGGPDLTIEGILSVPVSALQQAHSDWLPSLMDSA